MNRFQLNNKEEEKHNGSIINAHQHIGATIAFAKRCARIPGVLIAGILGVFISNSFKTEERIKKG